MTPDAGAAARRILVIVPAWNEAEGLSAVLAELRAAVPAADVLVVDDGSTDRTAQTARAAGARVARLPYNLGVGGAMRTGYRYALDQGYDTAVQVDADGQHDPGYVPALLAALETADLVVGARFAGVGDYRVRGPRRWSMRLLSLVLSGMAGTRLTDATSGLRACNRDMIAFFARWYPAEYLGDTVESMVGALRCGYRVRQVPVAMRPRTTGVPSQSPARALVYLARTALVLLLALTRRVPAPQRAEPAARVPEPAGAAR
ncbi:glycosyltransferase family 2 protein [Actinacidiphila paucisporea]|uniref:Glycosyl transferase family 2 n=1 Tax=Actinacidiphila paucisporea TaxID=310782 RepID=A0A1M6W8G4_9ACTN|nr:glycosyltransferase family 2 protein [Actinacidiphila paucisporea]SHK89987.1 Glycosyl transferase family 2 [Actinacidiphila paucisporea]